MFAREVAANALLESYLERQPEDEHEKIRKLYELVHQMYTTPISWCYYGLLAGAGLLLFLDVESFASMSEELALLAMFGIVSSGGVVGFLLGIQRNPSLRNQVREHLRVHPTSIHHLREFPSFHPNLQRHVKRIDLR